MPVVSFPDLDAPKIRPHQVDKVRLTPQPLCPHCGRRPAGPMGTWCSECWDTELIRRKADNPYEEW